MIGALVTPYVRSRFLPASDCGDGQDVVQVRVSRLATAVSDPTTNQTPRPPLGVN